MSPGDKPRGKGAAYARNVRPMTGSAPVTVIPRTPILARYRRLRTSAQSKRLAEATRLCAKPSELAEEFAASVELFSGHDQRHHPFYPERSANHVVSAKLKATKDLVLLLDSPEPLTPAPARATAPPRQGVASVPAAALTSRYVDRELLVHRTASPALWDDGRRNLGGLRLDVLLADAADGNPIVAELKLPGDMDPFFALVQALACAAHLATGHQHSRMVETLPRGHRLKKAFGRIDVFILLVERRGEGEAVPRGEFMPRLHEAVAELAQAVLARPELSKYVRRIAALGVRRTGSNVVATVRWAWEAEAPAT